MKSAITIDMRMIHSSGIGTYISNIVPRVIKDLNDTKFYLLGNEDELNKYAYYKNVEIIPCHADIYTIKEQFGLFNKIPRDTKLFWSPHYNIPVLYKGRLLVTIHDVFHLAMGQFVNGSVKKAYAKIMFNQVKRKADKIFSVSNFTKSQIETYLKYKKDDIVVTYNGVDDSWFQVPKSNDKEKPYLLYVGNVKPHKNLKTLIKAFGLLQEKVSHDLIIVGKKAGFLTGDNEITQIAEKYKERIHFTGFVEDKHLKSLVANADVFVFPSLYEGFGLPPLEAMACETPVAVSNIPPLKEVCGDAAVYFDPNDEMDMANSILNLINNSDLKNKLAAKGLKHANLFQWQKAADITQRIIKELINEP